MSHGAMTVLVAMTAMGLLTGCAPPSAVDHPAEFPARSAVADRESQQWGKTTILLDDNLRWPYSLGQLLVVVDGVPIYRHRAAEQRDALIDVLELQPGDHTIVVQAVAGYASAPLSDPDDCRVTLRATKSFRVDWSPAWLKLDLHLRGVTEHFAERVELAIGVRGAKAVDHHVVPHLHHEIHAPQSRQAILAGMEMRMEQARTNRDAAAAVCYDDKLNQARTLSQMLEERDDALRYADNRVRADHERTVIGAIEQRLERLWLETEQCVSHTDYVVEPLRTVSVSDEGACSGGGPLIDLEAGGRFSLR